MCSLPLSESEDSENLHFLAHSTGISECSLFTPLFPLCTVLLGVFSLSLVFLSAAHIITAVLRRQWPFQWPCVSCLPTSSIFKLDRLSFCVRLIRWSSLCWVLLVADSPSFFCWFENVYIFILVLKYFFFLSAHWMYHFILVTFILFSNCFCFSAFRSADEKSVVSLFCWKPAFSFCLPSKPSLCP